MGTRCLGFAMFVFVSCFLVLGISGADSTCSVIADPIAILVKCITYIKMSGQQLQPSNGCCAVMKIGNTVPCICQKPPPKFEGIVSMEKFVYVATFCGCQTPPPGQNCGSYIIPSTPAPVDPSPPVQPSPPAPVDPSPPAPVRPSPPVQPSPPAPIRPSPYKPSTPPSSSLSHFHPDARKKPSPPPPPPPPIVTPVDYFKMVETWPKSFCMIEKCINPAPPKFTIHGLWPSNRSDPQPRACFTTQKLDWIGLGVPIAKFYNYWPALNMVTRVDEFNFWIGQWSRHGTCSSRTPLDFYELAFKIHTEKKDLLNSLRLRSIIPDGKNKIKSQAILDAIESDIGSKAQITCRKLNKDYYLVQIGVCLDKDNFEYTDCSGTLNDPLNKCPPYVYFP